MNTFVLGALALTAAGGGSAPGAETEGEWLSLDREISSLASGLAVQDGAGPEISAFIKTSYANSSDIENVGGSDNDLGGFSLNNARVNISGSVGDYMLYVQLEGSDSQNADSGGILGGGTIVDGTPGAVDILGYVANPDGVGVLDAYVDFNITEEIKGRMGNFRPPVLSSALLDENRLLLINRTVNGEVWDFRDLGLMVNGNFDRLGWWVAVQNGIDAQGDELALMGRVTFNALGDGATRNVEGAYGADEENSLLLGLAYYMDDNLDDAEALAAEAHFTMNQISVSGEVVDYTIDDGMTIDEDLTPWSLTAGFMFVPEEWEGAVRYEDLDDDDDSTVLTVGVNRYVEGHDAKWQLNYSMVDSDDDTIEADILALALVVTI